MHTFKMRILGLLSVILLLIVTFGGVQAQEDGPEFTLPDNLKVITPFNVRSLELVATLGKGHLLDIGTLYADSILAVLSSNGIWLYDAADLSAAPTHIAFTINPFTEKVPGPTIHGEPPLDATFEDTTVRFVWQHQLWTIDVASGDQWTEDEPEDAEEVEYDEVVSPDGRWEVTMKRDVETLRRLFLLSSTETDTVHDISEAGCGGLSMQPTFAFSNDSARLFAATTGRDATITTWDVETGAFLSMTGEFADSVSKSVEIEKDVKTK